MADDRRVIVIGSGPAGAMAALTLLQQGIPVTMLESGRRRPRGLLVRLMGRNVLRQRPDLVAPQRFVSTGDPSARWYNDLAPGGLSNYWTGAVPRFAPEDFCEGERLHARYRWPLTYRDLSPYYAQVERLLGVVGSARDVPQLPAGCVAYPRWLPAPWRRVARCAAAFGQGLTFAPLADGCPWLVRRAGVAFDSFTGIVGGLSRFPHFRLALGAHALRLEWDGSRRRVGAVLYADRASGALHRLGAAAVVVAAGPLASTRLLLNSCCADFPDGLGNTAGLLGGYLHDHAHDFCWLDLERPLPRLGQAATLTRAPYRVSPPLLAAACTIGNDDTSAVQRALNLAPAPSRTFSVITFGTMIPTEDNYARLHPTLRDAFGLPLLDLHISFDDHVLCHTARARERLLSILDMAGYRATIRQALPRLTPGSSVHYGGTVRMHRSPRYGMLDAWNRLHAVANTLVVDASCFTTGAEKNPTLTVMALAARAADRLVVDLRTS